MNFKQLVRFLKDFGYNVKISREKYENQKSYQFAQIRTKNLRIGFCTKNNYSYEAINGKIAADHAECFNKWSQCPLKLEFPKNQQEMAILINLLEKLCQYEEESRTFKYLDNNPFHY